MQAPRTGARVQLRRVRGHFRHAGLAEAGAGGQDGPSRKTMQMFSDSPPSRAPQRRPQQRGAAESARALRENAPWGEAVLLTLGLWLFVLIVFLPIMFERGRVGLVGEASGVALSMALALCLFALFRVTLAWATAARLLLLLVGIGAAALVQTALPYLFADDIVAGFSKGIAKDQPAYGAAFNYLGVLFVNVACFQALFSLRQAASRERRRLEAREGAQEAQLAAVRAQMDPHFLFNTLNSISSLIVTKRNDDAEEMTLKLADFLRTSFANQPSQLVRVDAELALIEQYLDIEGVRFAKKLSVQIDIDDEAADRLVPPFLIQPLIENAVKHGVAPAKAPVGIRIAATLEGGKLRLSVCNDRVEAPAGCLGTGLVNLKRRLESVYGGAAALDIDAAEARFTATIEIDERLTVPADLLITAEPVTNGPMTLAN